MVIQAMTNVDILPPPVAENADLSPRNSNLREIFGTPIESLAGYIDREWPAVEPSDITKTGKWLVILANALVANDPESPIIPTILYTSGSLFDCLDGALDRIKRGRSGEELSIDGMIEDVHADKVEEIVTFCTLSLMARRRGRNLAATSYALAAMTSTLPSMGRAKAESEGYIVKESGVGTRTSRAILGGIGMAFNGSRFLPEIVSSVVSASNIKTAIGRYAVLGRGNGSQLYQAEHHDPKIKEAARIRHQTLKHLAWAGAAAGIVLLAYKPKGMD